MLQRDAQRRAFQIVVRLVRWRQQHGAFPASLDALNNVEGMPPAPDDLLKDPFTGESFLYRSTGIGFELRSLGKNCEFNETEYQQLGAVAWDVNWAEHIDLIWRWPADEPDSQSEQN